MHFATSFLFVPGDQPARFERACASQAGGVVLDLEDAVAPARKDAARHAVANWLDLTDRGGSPALVRINAAGTPWFEDDLALAVHPRVTGVFVPKAEDASLLASLAVRLAAHQWVLPLIETVKGHARLAALAAAPRVARLAFGAADFMADSGIESDGMVLDPIRLQFVMASRLAGIAAPIDGVTLAARDVERTRLDATHARRLGMGGKLCIHPLQVAAANEAFAVTPAQLEWAQEVVGLLQSRGPGAALVDGQLVDQAMLPRARAILARAAAADHTGEVAWAC